MMCKSLCAGIALVALALPSHADVMLQWDFQVPFPDLNNSAVSPSVAASFGTGVANGVHASPDTDWSTPAGNGSTESFSSNNWAAGDYYQFSFSTIGYTGGGVVLTFDQTRSSTGPDSFSVSYSADGGLSFEPRATYTVPAVTWSATAAAPSRFVFTIFDSTLDNQAAVVLRLTSNVTAAAGGTNRIDDVTIFTGVPEAGTGVMLAMGLSVLGLLARRR
jgi:hypothetical protein